MHALAQGPAREHELELSTKTVASVCTAPTAVTIDNIKLRKTLKLIKLLVLKAWEGDRTFVHITKIRISCIKSDIGPKIIKLNLFRSES